VTPGKRKKRPQSAPLHRSGHDLWMNAVKQRLTGTHFYYTDLLQSCKDIQ